MTPRYLLEGTHWNAGNLLGPRRHPLTFPSLRRDDPARVFVDDVLCLSTGQFGYDDAIALVHHQLVCLDLLQM